MPSWKRHQRRYIHEGYAIQVYEDKISYASQEILVYDKIEHPGAAAVVAITAQNELVLVEQPRYGADAVLIELPAGKKDGLEDFQICAKRELQEETGYTAKTWHPLGPMWTTPAFCNEQIGLWFAEDLIPGPTQLDAHEYLAVIHMPWPQAVKYAFDGTFTDAKTVVGILRAWAYLQNR